MTFLGCSLPLTNGSLDFAHDLIVGDRSSSLIVSNDLRLLINFLWKGFEHKQFTSFSRNNHEILLLKQHDLLSPLGKF